MHLPTSRLPALAACLFAAIAAIPAAEAAHYRDTSAGGACHPANGAAAGKFTFGNNVLTNVGTTDQYVICHLQMDDDEAQLVTTKPVMLATALTAGATGGTAVCVAQTGYWAYGSNHVLSSFSRSVPLAADGAGYAIWDESTPWVRDVPYQTLTLNCKLPAGFRMGLIEWLQ